MSAPCDGAHTSQAHAQYHQLAGAEAWAAQNPQPPILSFSFCHLLCLFFSIFLCTEVLRPITKVFPQLSLEALGHLLSMLGTLGPGL